MPQRSTILFRPYRAGNVFSIHNATNLLPTSTAFRSYPFTRSVQRLWGIVILSLNLVIGYWLFPIESNDNLSPDRPLAPCLHNERPCKFGRHSLSKIDTDPHNLCRSDGAKIDFSISMLQTCRPDGAVMITFLTFYLAIGYWLLT